MHSKGRLQVLELRRERPLRPGPLPLPREVPGQVPAHCHVPGGEDLLRGEEGLLEGVGTVH